LSVRGTFLKYCRLKYSGLRLLLEPLAQVERAVFGAIH
jgi:hypothetical protein